MIMHWILHRIRRGRILPTTLRNARQEKLSVTEAIEKILTDIEKMLVLHYNETSRQEN